MEVTPVAKNRTSLPVPAVTLLKLLAPLKIQALLPSRDWKAVLVTLPVAATVVVSSQMIDALSLMPEIPKQPVVFLSLRLQENRRPVMVPIGLTSCLWWHLRVCFQSPALLLLEVSCRTAGVPRAPAFLCPENLLHSSCVRWWVPQVLWCHLVREMHQNPCYDWLHSVSWILQPHLALKKA